LTADEGGLTPGKADRPPVPFETPTENLSVEDLKRRYGISKQTLYSRKNSARITGIHIKGKTYFTPEEVWCLDQVAGFVERGMTLPQIEKLVAEWKGEEQEEPDLQAGAPEPDLQVLTTPPPFGATSAGIPKAPDHATDTAETANGLAVIAEREEHARQLARAFTTAVGQALQDTRQVVGDPLRVHRLLSEAAREEWVLTGTQLAECCGLDSSTITGWRPSIIRCGFVLTCIGTALWEVRKATTEEVVAYSEGTKFRGRRPKVPVAGVETTPDADT